MASGLVFNIQRFSVHDGPGLRTTVFLKGCPARCPWCHNPESHLHAPELLRFPERCINCGTCREVCAHGTDPALCTACGTCAGACPADARQLAGTLMDAGEVMEIVARDRVFYDESGGGVTFSGGEPLAQPAFIRALVAAAREAGIRTAVDTCGFASRDLLLDLARSVDLFLYDVKILDPKRHQELVGLPLAPILSNLLALDAAGAQICVRVPIIPSLTDTPENLRAIADLVLSLPGVSRLSLLPYHSLGAAKCARLNTTYTLDRVAPPTADRMNALAGFFRARGMDTRVGG